VAAGGVAVPEPAVVVSASRRAISIGVLTESGRGWVSNNTGKPITPAATSTTAPISRWRARMRACWTESTPSDAALGASAERRFRKDSKPMR